MREVGVAIDSFFTSSLFLFYTSRAQEKERLRIHLCSPLHAPDHAQVINASNGADAPSASAPAPLALGGVCSSRRRRRQGEPSVDRRLHAGDGGAAPSV